jgi:predicted enzyme related to lactoylglutathione lyase
MKTNFLLLLGIITSFSLGFDIHSMITPPSVNLANTQSTLKTADLENTNTMKVGAFSMSLSVKDLKASKQFYENLGFTAFGGAMENNYLIMKNGNALIGLFQGMFEGNILTFNPGWDENAQNLETFDDIREIQRHLKSKGITIPNEIDETTSGPASIIITDPDGNVILFDQHR